MTSSSCFSSERRVWKAFFGKVFGGNAYRDRGILPIGLPRVISSEGWSLFNKNVKPMMKHAQLIHISINTGCYDAFIKIFPMI